MTIEELYKIIEYRKEKMPKDSYVSSLFKDGTDKIIQKVGEESTEVVIAAKNETKQNIVYEVADLLFHILILLAAYNINPEEVFRELERRKRKKT